MMDGIIPYALMKKGQYKITENDYQNIATIVESKYLDLLNSKATNVHLYSDGAGIKKFEDKDNYDIDYLTFEEIENLIKDDTNSVFITNGFYSMYSKYQYLPVITGEDKRAIGFIGVCELDGEVYTWRIVVNEDGDVKEDEIRLAKASDKVSSISDTTSTTQYPSVKAMVDYVAEHGGSGSGGGEEMVAWFLVGDETEDGIILRVYDENDNIVTYNDYLALGNNKNILLFDIEEDPMPLSFASEALVFTFASYLSDDEVIIKTCYVYPDEDLNFVADYYMQAVNASHIVKFENGEILEKEFEDINTVVTKATYESNGEKHPIEGEFIDGILYTYSCAIEEDDVEKFNEAETDPNKVLFVKAKTPYAGSSDAYILLRPDIHDSYDSLYYGESHETGGNAISFELRWKCVYAPRLNKIIFIRLSNNNNFISLYYDPTTETLKVDEFGDSISNTALNSLINASRMMETDISIQGEHTYCKYDENSESAIGFYENGGKMYAEYFKVDNDNITHNVFQVDSSSSGDADNEGRILYIPEMESHNDGEIENFTLYKDIECTNEYSIDELIDIFKNTKNIQLAESVYISDEFGFSKILKVYEVVGFNISEGSPDPEEPLALVEANFVHVEVSNMEGSNLSGDKFYIEIIKNKNNEDSYLECHFLHSETANQESINSAYDSSVYYTDSKIKPLKNNVLYLKDFEVGNGSVHLDNVSFYDGIYSEEPLTNSFIYYDFVEYENLYINLCKINSSNSNTYKKYTLIKTGFEKIRVSGGYNYNIKFSGFDDEIGIMTLKLFIGKNNTTNSIDYNEIPIN